MTCRHLLAPTPILQQIGAVADQLHLPTYVVGGFVRDLLLQGGHATEDELKAIDKDIKNIVNENVDLTGNVIKSKSNSTLCHCDLKKYFKFY